jgi:chromosome segregation ATPase
LFAELAGPFFIFAGALILLAAAVVQLVRVHLNAKAKDIQHKADLRDKQHENEMKLAQQKAESDAEIAKAHAQIEIEKFRLEAQMRADEKQFILDTARKDQERVSFLEGRVDTLSSQLMNYIERRGDQERLIGEQQGELVALKAFFERTSKEREAEQLEIQNLRVEVQSLRDRQQSRHDDLNAAQVRVIQSEEQLQTVIAERDRLRREIETLLQKIPRETADQNVRPFIDDEPAQATGSTYEGVNIPAALAATNTLVETPLYPSIEQDKGS